MDNTKLVELADNLQTIGSLIKAMVGTRQIGNISGVMVSLGQSFTNDAEECEDYAPLNTASPQLDDIDFDNDEDFDIALPDDLYLNGVLYQGRVTIKEFLYDAADTSVGTLKTRWLPDTKIIKVKGENGKVYSLTVNDIFVAKKLKEIV